MAKWKGDLQTLLDRRWSYARIGRAVGVAPGTVSAWARWLREGVPGAPHKRCATALSRVARDAAHGPDDADEIAWRASLEFLVERGWSPARIAASLNGSEKSVQLWLHGTTTPVLIHQRNLVKLAEKLRSRDG
jgi:hypothetical protein